MAGNAAIGDRLRSGGETIMRKNPTMQDHYVNQTNPSRGTPKTENLYTDPNLAQMRFIQAQVRTNGAAGVSRRGVNILKSSSTPGLQSYNPLNH